MESSAHPKQAWSPLQFGRASLTPNTIPQAHTAVQAGIASLFMRDYGYLVDFKAHSALCLEALQGGLIRDTDLKTIAESPNGYGLHLVTNQVVNIIGAKVQFLSSEIVQDAAQLATNLSRPMTDIKYAAGVALAVAEAGLLHDSALAPIMERGSDCGFELLSATEEALDTLWPAAQRESRNVKDGEVYTDTPFETHLHGTNFYLSAYERNCFYLEWPAITQENLEVHIFLCKTLDAMSNYLVPFHTPASAYGFGGQYSYGPSELFEALGDQVAGLNQEAITEVLLATEDISELGMLGMALEESGEDEGEAAHQIAGLLWEIADIEKNYSFRLAYDENTSDQSRKVEMSELQAQLRDVIAKGTPHSGLCKVLSDALDACIARADSHRTVSEMISSASEESADEGAGYEESPNRFFDCIWVIADGRHDLILQDALEAFNADLEEVSEVAAKLPLNSGELVSQITIPVIERTNQCLALLRRIQLCLEAEKNA